MSKEKVILAFSGGLDTSAIIPWLQDEYGYDVIAYCADLGNAPDAEHLTPWAEKLGAIEFIFEDLKEIFARDFVFKSLLAGAVYQDDYLLGCSVGRPLIAARMAYHAKRTGAVAVAHGATGKGNDQLRFEQGWAQLLPDCKVIAPWKIWPYTGRQDLRDYLATKDIHMDAKDKKYSVDENLMQRSCGGGVLEDITLPYEDEEIFDWVTPPSKLSLDSQTITIAFEKGMPVALDGEKLGAAELLHRLNQIAGKHGIGHIDVVEDRIIGIKTRDTHETPGSTVLFEAYKQLKSICWDRNLRSTARFLGDRLADHVYDGLWFSDDARSIREYFEMAGRMLSGEIILKLTAGNMQVMGRKSPNTLYDELTVSFESDDMEINKHATGYSKLVTYNSWRAGQRDKGTDILEGKEHHGDLKKSA